MEAYYLALNPDSDLADLIKKQKDAVEELAGNQKYLHDPPHLTLIVFSTHDLKNMILRLKDFLKKIKGFKINLNGLHVFYNDAFTGGHTLAYFLTEEDAEILRDFQLAIVNYINNLNSKELILKESDSFKKMSPEEKANVEKYGFPFIGENWIPHITLASIEKDEFDLVFQKIKDSPIEGEYSIDSINLYKVGEESSILIESFKLN